MFQIIIFTALVVLLMTSASKQKCAQKLDIAFVYEIPDQEELKSLTLFEDIFENLTVNLYRDGCFQTSLIVVGDNVDVVRPITCNTKCDEVKKKFEEIKGKYNGTRFVKERLSRAFRSLKHYVFTTYMGARSDAKKMIVLILTTANQLENTAEILDEIKYLEIAGAHDLCVIGSKHSNIRTLEFGFAYPEGKIIQLDQFDELLPGRRAYTFLVDYLTGQSADDLYGSECKNVADIAFLIDSSRSIRNDYQFLLEFVNLFMINYGLSELGTHAGVIVFSDFGSYTSVEIRFNDHYNIYEFMNHVGKLPFYGFRSRIDLAFEVAEQRLFVKEAGARDNVTKIIILLTDSAQKPPFSNGKVLDPVESSQGLIYKGVKIFTIGIGNQLDREKLINIARDPERVYIVNTPFELSIVQFVQSLIVQICNSIS